MFGYWGGEKVTLSIFNVIQLKKIRLQQKCSSWLETPPYWPGEWCEGICVCHLDSQTNQIWELSVLNGAPQPCDFKAQTLCEVAPLLQILLETKPKHQNVITWGRSGRVCAETAIHWDIQLCSGAVSPETRMEAEGGQPAGRCHLHHRLPGCCSQASGLKSMIFF